MHILATPMFLSHIQFGVGVSFLIEKNLSTVCVYVVPHFSFPDIFVTPPMDTWGHRVTLRCIPVVHEVQGCRHTAHKSLCDSGKPAGDFRSLSSAQSPNNGLDTDTARIDSRCSRGSTVSADTTRAISFGILC